MSVLSIAEQQAVEQPVSTPVRDDSPRPHLAVLPRLRRRQKGLMVSVVAVLAVALAAVLAINIYVANSQYALVQMQNERTALVHENQTLSEQVQLMESPQALADAAVGYGLVLPGTAGTLDLETGNVGGAASEAEADERPSSFVPAPSLLGEPRNLAGDVSDQVEGAPRGLFGSGALSTLNHEVSTESAGEELSEGSEQLNGGTIPAPSLAR